MTYDREEQDDMKILKAVVARLKKKYATNPIILEHLKKLTKYAQTIDKEVRGLK